MQTLKDPEQFSRVSHIKSNTVIAHEIDIFLLSWQAANLNDSHLTATGVLHCIGQEICPYLFQQNSISKPGQQFLDSNIDISVLGLHVDLRQTVMHQTFHIDEVLLQTRTTQPREGKKVIDERSH